MTIEQIREKLFEIKELGFVQSKRKGNTGIGYTLETLLGIAENNFKTPDFGEIELKSQRKGVTSRVTMFTFNKGAWLLKPSEAITRYGYFDENERKSLYCFVTSKPNNQGLFTRIDESAMQLYHTDGTLIAGWSVDSLMQAFDNKLPALVMVFADTRIVNEREEFWFNQAYFLHTPSRENFIDSVRRDVILLDVRMHLKSHGAVRNHGTAFRIIEQFLPQCFAIKEILI